MDCVVCFAYSRSEALCHILSIVLPLCEQWKSEHVVCVRVCVCVCVCEGVSE